MKSATRSGTTRTPGWVRLIDTTSTTTVWIAGAALVLMACTVLTDVFARQLFNSPLVGGFELTAYWWMPTSVIAAFAFTELKQEHIRVNLMLDGLHGRARRIADGTVGLATVAILLVLSYYTLQDALHSWSIGLTASGAVPLAIWPAKILAGVAMALFALQAVASLYRAATTRTPTTRSDSPVPGSENL